MRSNPLLDLLAQEDLLISKNQPSETTQKKILLLGTEEEKTEFIKILNDYLKISDCTNTEARNLYNKLLYCKYSIDNTVVHIYCETTASLRRSCHGLIVTSYKYQFPNDDYTRIVPILNYAASKNEKDIKETITQFMIDPNKYNKITKNKIMEKVLTCTTLLQALNSTYQHTVFLPREIWMEIIRHILDELKSILIFDTKKSISFFNTQELKNKICKTYNEIKAYKKMESVQLKYKKD